MGLNLEHCYKTAILVLNIISDLKQYLGQNIFLNLISLLVGYNSSKVNFI